MLDNLDVVSSNAVVVLAFLRIDKVVDRSPDDRLFLVWIILAHGDFSHVGVHETAPQIASDVVRERIQGTHLAWLTKAEVSNVSLVELSSVEPHKLIVGLLCSCFNVVNLGIVGKEHRDILLTFYWL